MIKIAINGCGRIGRIVFKAITSKQDWGRVQLSPRIDRGSLEVVALNNLGGIDDSLAHLFKYDSVYGTYPGEVRAGDNGKSLFFDGREYPFFNGADPEQLPWGELEVDVVLECTGAFTDFQKARAHIRAGAKRVVITANGKGEGLTLVLGTDSIKVLDQGVDDPVQLEVVAGTSCTTNCAGPVVQLLHDHLTVLKAQMVTVHAVTSTQSLVDVVNKNMRRSRAAYASIVPQSTGAAEAVTKAIPDLDGRISGAAYRVPVLCGSVLEVVAQVQKETTVEEVNSIFKTAAQGDLGGIIEVSEDGLVSSDIIGNPVASVVDLALTEVIDLPGVKDENMVKVVAWYDNEYGAVCRYVELAQILARLG